MRTHSFSTVGGVLLYLFKSFDEEKLLSHLVHLNAFLIHDFTQGVECELSFMIKFDLFLLSFLLAALWEALCGEVAQSTPLLSVAQYIGKTSSCMELNRKTGNPAALCSGYWSEDSKKL